MVIKLITEALFWLHYCPQQTSCQWNFCSKSMAGQTNNDLLKAQSEPLSTTVAWGRAGGEGQKNVICSFCFNCMRTVWLPIYIILLIWEVIEYDIDGSEKFKTLLKIRIKIGHNKKIYILVQRLKVRCMKMNGIPNIVFLISSLFKSLNPFTTALCLDC